MERYDIDELGCMSPRADGDYVLYADAQRALDAEREKVKGLHEITKVICTHCCEPMEIPSKAVLQTQLSQLQALVRALPNLEHFDVGVDDHGGEIRLPDGYILFTATSRNRTHALEKLLKYRATLDATTPAPDTSIIGKCEPPAQWNPNAQIRGDVG